MRTGIEKYDGSLEVGAGQRIRSLTLSENLEARKAGLEQELNDINDAIAALKANPEVEKVINLISRI